MLRSDRCGSKAGVVELVGLALGEPDGEGANRLDPPSSPSRRPDRSNRFRRRERSPSGTSLIRWLCTAVSSLARRSLARSSRPGRGTICLGSATASIVAFGGRPRRSSRACCREEACRFRGRTSLRPRRSAWRETPGSTSRSKEAAMPPAARMALISEAKISAVGQCRSRGV